ERINTLVTKIYQIIFHQRHASIGTVRDEMMQQSNEKFVTYFSCIQIVVIILVGVFQTYAIRKFFNVDEKRARI
uniref:GOLD domain-containing protein n=1 Tax=Panagrolaimus sp. PS1159 TaxID=55785 RepID=A0AC35FB88_9BILA